MHQNKQELSNIAICEDYCFHVNFGFSSNILTFSSGYLWIILVKNDRRLVDNMGKNWLEPLINNISFCAIDDDRKSTIHPCMHIPGGRAWHEKVSPKRCRILASANARMTPHGSFGSWQLPLIKLNFERATTFTPLGFL